MFDSPRRLKLLLPLSP